MKSKSVKDMQKGGDKGKKGVYWVMMEISCKGKIMIFSPHPLVTLFSVSLFVTMQTCSFRSVNILIPFICFSAACWYSGVQPRILVEKRAAKPTASAGLHCLMPGVSSFQEVEPVDEYWWRTSHLPGSFPFNLYTSSLSSSIRSLFAPFSFFPCFPCTFRFPVYLPFCFTVFTT